MGDARFPRSRLAVGLSMRFDPRQPPRAFRIGDVEMRDCATLALDADEQVTFVTANGAEYDVARKDWGFYATPSLDGRLAGFGLRAVLVRSEATGRRFLLLVETGREESFDRYLAAEKLRIVCWLDSAEACGRLDRLLAGER
jgi:hypothetical protein